MQVILEDGKYTVTFDESTGKLSAKRYNQPWRDLAGDNLVLAMLQEIVRLRELVDKVEYNHDEQ